jgi:hypothetical protein
VACFSQLRGKRHVGEVVIEIESHRSTAISRGA